MDHTKRVIKSLDIAAKQNADQFSETMVVGTKSILAVTEAFQLMERRAEAAEGEVQRLNATAQPVSDGWVKCSEQMPPVKTAIIVGKWNGRLWATKWATYIPSHPEANSFGYIMPGGSWEPDFWMIIPAGPDKVKNG